jgi:antitoxin ParD1/3/4
MATNVHLTPELEQFARDRVNTGRYASMSEVVRDGLRLLQDQEVARQSAEAARREELARQQEESARRQLAFKAMLDPGPAKSCTIEDRPRYERHRLR